MNALGFATGSTILVAIATSAVAQSQTETYSYDVHGRLTATEVTGGAHDNDARSTCYDELGNRRTFRVSVDGSVLSCPAPSTQAPPDPVSSNPTAPSDPPAVGNSVPQPTTDNLSSSCYALRSIDIIANDIDPDGDALTLLSVTEDITGTGAYVDVINGVAQVSFGSRSGTDRWRYDVADIHGATATGFIYITTNCSNDGGGYETF